MSPKKPVLKQTAAPAMALVKGHGISGEQPPHDAGNRLITSF